MLGPDSHPPSISPHSRTHSHTHSTSPSPSLSPPRTHSINQHLQILRILMCLLMITLFGFSVFYIMSAVVQAIILAGVISLVVILFTVMMFLGYDALRNHQQTANSLVLESKRLFIRYVSHEIRGPLNTVHLGLKLLIQEMEEARAELSSSTNNSVTVGVLDDGNGDDNDCVMSSRLVEWVALIDELELSTERVVTVLNELVHSDDVASGCFRVSTQYVNLWEVVESSVQHLTREATQSGVGLFLDMEVYRAKIAEDDYATTLKQLRVIGDAGKLEQVVSILVGLFLKRAGRSGRVIVKVFWELNEEWQEEGLIDNEHDNGMPYEAVGAIVVTVCSVPGPATEVSSLSPLPQQNLHDLHEHHRQFNAALLHSGGDCGELELWISKGIVESHHGRVIATPGEHSCGESTYHTSKKGNENFIPNVDIGQGSCIRLELPAVVLRPLLYDDDVFSDSSDEVKEDEAASTDHNSMMLDLSYNVLVVDDSVPSRKLLCRLLSNLGCSCTQAENGIECINIVHKFQQSHDHRPFDFILLDYEMPRMNGPDAARTLREEGIFTPIIGVTGNVLPEDQQRFLHSGANRVLRKPLSIPLLEKVLVDIIMRNDEISYIV